MVRNVFSFPGLCALFLLLGSSCLITLEVWGSEMNVVPVPYDVEPQFLLSAGWALILLGCVVGIVFLLRSY